MPILCEPFTRHQPQGPAARRHHAHEPRRRARASLLRDVDARRVHRRSGIGRDRDFEGDPVRSRLHHRLRRHDRRRRGRCARRRSSRARASLVIGCGAVGLNALQGAQARGRGDDHRRRRRRGQARTREAVRRDARRRRRLERRCARADPRAHRRPRRRLRLRGGGQPIDVPPVGRSGASRRPGGMARQDQRQRGGELPLGLADGREAHRALELRRRACRSAISPGSSRISRRPARCSTS